MITGISIENFKGIRERIELPLRPVTLLFGPNSAGKSSIIHALHYAREIFERRNFDPDRTVSGGTFVDLGGFARLVHGRDPLRAPVVLGFEMRLSGIPSFFVDAFGQPDRLPAVRVSTAAVEIEITWSDILRRPHCSSYAVSLNGERFARIRAYPERTGAVLLEYLNIEHPIITAMNTVTDGEDELEGISDESDDFDDVTEEDYDDEKERLQSDVRALGPDTAFLRQMDALPDWGRLLVLRSVSSAHPPSRDVRLRDPEDASLSREDWRSIHEVDDVESDRDASLSDFAEDRMLCFLTRYIVGPGRLLAERLNNFRYLGPVRETPPRNYEPVRFADRSRWPSGLGAWDELHMGDDAIVEQVSAWLGDPDRLAAGYRLRRLVYKEIDLGNPLVNQLVTGRAFDESDADSRLALDRCPTRTRLTIVPAESEVSLQAHDVGIGISQLIPVVVTAVTRHIGLSAIEQPELHIHPRLQAELGDLFLESALGGDRSFLIETHSEHLILRLQRRIRETFKGTPHRGMPVRPDDVAVYYVSQDDGRTLVRRIELDDKGDFIQPWPDNFFEIDFHERFA